MRRATRGPTLQVGVPFAPFLPIPFFFFFFFGCFFSRVPRPHDRRYRRHAESSPGRSAPPAAGPRQSRHLLPSAPHRSRRHHRGEGLPRSCPPPPVTAPSPSSISSKIKIEIAENRALQISQTAVYKVQRCILLHLLVNIYVLDFSLR